MDELMVRIENVTKEYKLGQIGGTTLQESIQRFNAKLLHKEDPTKKIGASEEQYGEKFLALSDVSFDVKKGERVGIIGHNGAGKSTLLKLVSRITAPTSGFIGLNGRITSMLEVGTGFHAELTGRENIYMNGAILGMTKKEIDAKMEDIIEFSECRKFIDTPVKRYSSGMYVKLAFSVAAHLDSEIMIMDEVLAVGDMAFQKKCLDKMTQVSKDEGRTILYVSHNMNTIRQLCDRVIVLNHGRVTFDGDVEEGISIYMDEEECSQKEIDLTACKRTHDHASMGEVVLERIVSDRDSGWRIPVTEKLEFSIHLKANKDLENVGFRMGLSTADGFAITVFLAPNLFSCKKGEKITIPLQADTSLLAPGKYVMTAVLYGVNEYGAWSFYDHVGNAVIFEVENQLGFNENMDWDPRHWGHVKLPELAVTGSIIKK